MSLCASYSIRNLLYRSPLMRNELRVQANNAYIFPAIGLAAVLTKTSRISDDAFLTAAKHLSQMTQIPVSKMRPFLRSLGWCMLAHTGDDFHRLTC